MRDLYERQLQELLDLIREMGRRIEDGISGAIDALICRNREEAGHIIQYDEEVNLLQRKIENLCFQLLLRQQPVATDLRMVSSALKIVTDMERIGDHAADISEITLLLTEAGYPRDLMEIQKMAEEALSMVTDSICAYIEKDGRKAAEVICRDDLVDQYFLRIKQGVIRQINESMEGGEQEADLLMIAKYLERIGDHATNIAEWVLYYLTGECPETPA